MSHRHSNGHGKSSFSNDHGKFIKKNRIREHEDSYDDGDQPTKKPSKIILIVNIILKIIILILIIYTIWMNNKILNTTITPESKTIT